MPLKREYLRRFAWGVALDLQAALVKAAPNSAVTRAKTGAYGVGGGHLQRNIRAEVEGDSKIQISMPGYWIHIERGTPPHIIRPKNGKALAWGRPQGTTKDGKTKREFVVRVVNHPGTKPNPFTKRTILRELSPIIVKNARIHLGAAA